MTTPSGKLWEALPPGAAPDHPNGRLLARRISKQKNGTLVVTGANGFIGRSILAGLKPPEGSIRGTDLGETDRLSEIEYRSADITRLTDMQWALEGAATVIHAAGLAHVFSPEKTHPESFREINEIGTARTAAAAAAAGVGHFILISSVSVYGPYTTGDYGEETPCRPVGPYAVSKYRAEQQAVRIARDSGMALTILRLATVYGENDPGNVGRLIRFLDRGLFLWVGDGGNRKSLLHKDDAARACIAAARRPASGINIYNLSAPPCTMREIVEGISDALGKRPMPLGIPAPLALALGRSLSWLPSPRLSRLEQTVRKWLAEDVYDCRRFERRFGFQAATPLREGLRREVDWFRLRQAAARTGGRATAERIEAGGGLALSEAKAR